MGHPVPWAVAAALGALEAHRAGLCASIPDHVCGFQVYGQLFNGHSQSSTVIVQPGTVSSMMDAPEEMVKR